MLDSVPVEIEPRLPQILVVHDGMASLHALGLVAGDVHRYRAGHPGALDVANRHGHLPKADPETPAPELHGRLGVWFERAYRDDNLFLTLARRPAVLDLFLAWVSFIYAGRSTLDPTMVELCRICLAARNQCVH